MQVGGRKLVVSRVGLIWGSNPPGLLYPGPIDAQSSAATGSGYFHSRQVNFNIRPFQTMIWLIVNKREEVLLISSVVPLWKAGLVWDRDFFCDHGTHWTIVFVAAIQICFLWKEGLLENSNHKHVDCPPADFLHKIFKIKDLNYCTFDLLRSNLKWNDDERKCVMAWKSVRAFSFLHSHFHLLY